MLEGHVTWMIHNLLNHLAQFPSIKTHTWVLNECRIHCEFSESTLQVHKGLDASRVPKLVLNISGVLGHLKRALKLARYLDREIKFSGGGGCIPS